MEYVMELFALIALLYILIMPFVILGLWIVVLVLAVKNRKIPEEDIKRKKRVKRILKSLLITASVMTGCLILLLIWFMSAMSQM